MNRVSVKEKLLFNDLRPRHTMQKIAATGRCNKSLRACDMSKSLSLRQNFVTAICRTNSYDNGSVENAGLGSRATGSGRGSGGKRGV